MLLKIISNALRLAKIFVAVLKNPLAQPSHTLNSMSGQAHKLDYHLTIGFFQGCLGLLEPRTLASVGAAQ